MIDVKAIIKELEQTNPYPTDVFLPKSKKDWERLHKIMKKAKINFDGYAGECCRIGYHACIFKVFQILNELNEEQDENNN